MEFFGLNPGFGYDKAWALRTGKGIVQPAMLGEPKKLPVYEKHHIRVEYEGQQFFYGDLAVNQSTHRYHYMEDYKADNPHFKIRLLTLMALATGETRDVDFAAVTGLPVDYYESQEQDMRKLLDGIQGEQIKVTIGERTICPRFNCVTAGVTWEPLGTFYDLVYDELCLDRKENEYLFSGTGVFVDWGLGNYQIVVFEDGELMDTLSSSPKEGMHSTLERIGRQLNGKNLHQIDKMLRSGKDIANADEILEANARVINQAIHNRNVEIDWAVLTGGGMIQGGQYILPEISNKIIVPDAQIANARGFAKAARLKWAKSGQI